MDIEIGVILTRNIDSVKYREIGTVRHRGNSSDCFISTHQLSVPKAIIITDNRYHLI